MVGLNPDFDPYNQPAVVTLWVEGKNISTQWVYGGNFTMLNMTVNP